MAASVRMRASSMSRPSRSSFRRAYSLSVYFCTRAALVCSMKPTSFSSVHRRASTSSRSFSPSAARMAAKFSSAAAATACTSCQSSASSASACTALNISGKRHSPESDTSLRISSCRAISSMAALYCLASSIFGVMTVSGASTFTMVRFSSALPRAILPFTSFSAYPPERNTRAASARNIQNSANSRFLSPP